MKAPALCTVVLAALAMSVPALAGPFSGVSADDAPRAMPPAARAADLDEQLGGQVDMKLLFQDQDGMSAALGEHFRRGRPVVLLLAYYHCPMLCGLSLRGLVKGVRELPWVLGEQYDLLTVSFDPSDGPLDARRKRTNAIDALGRPSPPDAWPFLIGPAESIRALTDQIGFRYGRDERSGQFAHPAAIVVLTAGGVVSRYLYGVEYSARDLRLALLEASQGRTGGIVDRILMTCYQFDPASHKYAAFILGFMRLGAAFILAAVILLLLVLYGKERTRRRNAGVA